MMYYYVDKCKTCKYLDLGNHEYPCSECHWLLKDKYEPKEDE